jgi:hypothetical protein
VNFHYVYMNEIAINENSIKLYNLVREIKDLINRLVLFHQAHQTVPL